jgi:Holliday junction DNA helicase RuvB
MTAEPNPNIVSTSTAEDIAADKTLRPKRLADYIGQQSVHDQM